MRRKIYDSLLTKGKAAEPSEGLEGAYRLQFYDYLPKTHEICFVFLGVHFWLFQSLNGDWHNVLSYIKMSIVLCLR